MITLEGVAASPGIAIGKVKLIKEQAITVEKTSISSDMIEQEIEKLYFAIETAKSELSAVRDHTQNVLGPDEAAVFTAHMMMLEDPELLSAIEKKIRTDQLNVQAAVDEAINTYKETLLSLEDDYIRARAADLEDIGKRMLRILSNREEDYFNLSTEAILVAKDLSPSVTAKLDTKYVQAFATQDGSRTSHTAILARNLWIPAVVGIGDKLLDLIKEADQVIVDGDCGKVMINPNEDVLSYYRQKLVDEKEKRQRLTFFKDKPAISRDGTKVKILGNIGKVEECEAVLDNGGEGIGLFRTEFLYMGNSGLPSEEEQFTAYSEVAKKMEGKELIIRTLDVGGDKELSCLQLPVEDNPYLGYRAVRLCLDREDIFKPQLRAILRSGLYGDVKVMFPMISSLDEYRNAVNIFNKAKQELNEENIPYKKDMQVGIMVEIPAAALIANELAEEVDFFSIGTNDLVQYTLAADRNNEKVAASYIPYHPAVLRLIKMIVDAAKNKGIMVGMCGEVSGDEQLIPLWLGFGLDELSMSPGSILKAKEIITNWSADEAKGLVAKALNAYTSNEVLKIIQE